MEFKIVQKPGKKHQLFILDDVNTLKQIAEINENEQSFSSNAFKKEQSFVSINQYNRYESSRG